MGTKRKPKAKANAKPKQQKADSKAGNPNLDNDTPDGDYQDAVQAAVAEMNDSDNAGKDDDAELEAALAALSGEGTEDATETDTTSAEDATVNDLTGEDVDEETVEQALAKLEKEENEKKAKSTSSKPKAGSKGSKPKGKSEKVETAPARNFYDVAAIDKPTFDKTRGALAKKVGEKADNVVQAIERGKKLSRYTADAVLLLSKEGRMSAKRLCEAFINANLSEGTARAQSQQMTSLFKALGIAEPDPANAKDLIVKDKGLVDELVKLAA